VSGLLEGAEGGTYTPVQFCTSPPLDVYKPRKSQSPPPKLFHMSMNGSSGIPRQNSLDSVRPREGPGRPSGAFRPRPRAARVGNSGLVEFSSLDGEGGEFQLREEVERGESSSLDHESHGHRSPNKRHRSTPRPHNIQRPCLDFEKMQQIKTRVVTSWRQGTELSLFCWWDTAWRLGCQQLYSPLSLSSTHSGKLETATYTIRDSLSRILKREPQMD